MMLHLQWESICCLLRGRQTHHLLLHQLCRQEEHFLSFFSLYRMSQLLVDNTFNPHTFYNNNSSSRNRRRRRRTQKASSFIIVMIGNGGTHHHHHHKSERSSLSVIMWVESTTWERKIPVLSAFLPSPARQTSCVIRSQVLSLSLSLSLFFVCYAIVSQYIYIRRKDHTLWSKQSGVWRM